MRFKVRDTTLAFFSCHLNAHEGEARRRRRDEDVAEILSGARCGPSFELDAGAQSHHSFFMGDMNYRVALPGYELPAKRPSALPIMSVARRIQGNRKDAPDENVALNQDADDESSGAMDDVDARAARKRVFEQHHAAVRARLAARGSALSMRMEMSCGRACSRGGCSPAGPQHRPLTRQRSRCSVAHARSSIPTRPGPRLRMRVARRTM